jgi:hypothetical protein
MTSMSRRAALANLAESHEIHRWDQNSGAEDLRRYLDHPETICRWVAVTRATDMLITYLVADFATSAEAKEAAEENIEHLHEELPVEVVDLDSGTTIACRLKVVWADDEETPKDDAAQGSAA